jgi:hypothetical protein
MIIVLTRHPAFTRRRENEPYGERRLVVRRNACVIDLVLDLESYLGIAAAVFDKLQFVAVFISRRSEETGRRFQTPPTN